MASSFLEVKHLKKYFNTPRGSVHAVDDVTFSLEKGETMGLVGESGCGKSTLGRTIIHLLESTEGSIYFEGQDITHLKKAGLRKLREDMQIIFQDPYSSLNPRLTLRDTVMEPLKLSGRYNKKELEEETDRLMSLVGIEKRFRNSYPHELDGGRRQRVGIARAIALNPKFIVCDEPVSALDVSIQAQILNLLMQLQKDLKLSYLFISHDLNVVRHISNRVGVMYLGRIVEMGETEDVYCNPMHPYTQALLSAIPKMDPLEQTHRIRLEGDVPSPANPPKGCAFHDRCRQCMDICRTEVPETKEIAPGHCLACHLFK